MKLTRTKQCATCPWKNGADLSKIPGYNQEKHIALSKTIANGVNIGNTLHVMACHHSSGDDGMYCVGWLHNQLGSGNNIALRLAMRQCENIGELKVTGPQHKTFEDTLP